MNLDSVDHTLNERIAVEEPSFRECIACGSCTASCTAGKYTPTSVRRAILCLQNGQKDKALELVDKCLLCGKCTMVCPRGVNTRHLVMTILKIASAK